MKISFKNIINIFIIAGFFFGPVPTLAADANTTVTTPPLRSFSNATYSNTVFAPIGSQDSSPQYDSNGQLIPRATIVGDTNGNPYDPNNGSLTPNYVNAQIQNSIGTASSSQSSQGGSSATKGVAGAVGCGASQILANIVTSTVSSAVGGASSAIDTATKVPVAEGGVVGENIKQSTSARVGGVAGLGGVSTLTAPSWDAVAYCVVNAMIIYVADSTIRWINTGFQGNPAFLDNPDQFFKQLANQEAAGFVQNLAYGVTGVNVCDVYRGVMVRSILNQYAQQNGYGQGYDRGGYGQGQGINNGFLGCSFDQNPAQLNSFLKGNFSQGGGWNSWFQLTQNANNNPFDTYFNTQARLQSQVNAVQRSNERELGWNNGFKSFRKCDTKTQDPKSCPVVTPGLVIQNQLNESLNLGKNRLVLADKFDQVVSAVFDQLIQTALNKVLESSNK